MHDGLFLRLCPGFREPPWKFEKSLSMFWGMVFRSQLTSGTVFGEQVGCRLLMSHLNSLCFISCCWVLRWEQSFFFFILYFCMPFAKWCCFCTRKKLLGNSVARVGFILKGKFTWNFVFSCDYWSPDFKMLPSGTSSNKRFLKHVRVGAADANRVLESRTTFSVATGKPKGCISLTTLLTWSFHFRFLKCHFRHV